MEVRHDDGPPLVLDCGTGARALGFKLVGEKCREMDMVFSHFHMDHVFGFPFFVPIYTPGYTVRISVPAFSEEEAREKLGRYLNGVYHPTRLRELAANVVFQPIRPGRSFQAGVFQVKGLQLNHPGGSVGYRIEADGRSFAYITDTAPFARPGEGVAAGEAPTSAEARVIDFLRSCDTVVYDTMYDEDEYLEKMTWGHSYPEYAQAICQAAGVHTLVLFHHLPEAADEMLDALERKWHARAPGAPGVLRVVLAKEGETIDVVGPERVASPAVAVAGAGEGR